MSSGIPKVVVSTTIPCEKDRAEKNNKNRKRGTLIIQILLIGILKDTNDFIFKYMSVSIL
jgi:hypothetical protein